MSMPSIRTRPLTIYYDVPIARTEKFWNGIKEGKIYATKCKKCTSRLWPTALTASPRTWSGLS